MSTTSHRAPRRQFWLEHIAACAESGESVKSYAEAHGLSAASLYAARSRYRQVRPGGASRSASGDEARAAARFVRVEPPSQTGGERVQCRVRLGSGTMLELSVEVSALEATLRAIATVT